MIKKIIKRLLYLAVLLLAVSLLTYLMTPGNPGKIIDITSSHRAVFVSRYTSWLCGIFISDNANFGSEVFNNSQRVTLISFNKLVFGTISLAVASLICVIIISLPLGMLSAVKKDSVLDYVTRVIAFIFASIPNYSLAIILIFVFAVRLKWFPVLSDKEARGIVLPLCSLSIPLTSRFIRYIRAAALDELGKDYVTGAIARGVRKWRVMVFHVLPCIAPSILSYIHSSIGFLLGTVIIIENIHSWKGIGSLVVNAINTRNYIVLQAYIMWMAVLYVSVIILIDIIMHFMGYKL